jgi:hypothetical protein
MSKPNSPSISGGVVSLRRSRARQSTALGSRLVRAKPARSIEQKKSTPAYGLQSQFQPAGSAWGPLSNACMSPLGRFDLSF